MYDFSIKERVLVTIIGIIAILIISLIFKLSYDMYVVAIIGNISYQLFDYIIYKIRNK